MDAKGILSDLVSFRTVASENPDYVGCAEYIGALLQKAGFDVEIVDGGDGTTKKPNVLAFMGGKNCSETLLFAAHYDVVPAGDGWDTNPWEAIEKDGRLFGRGASDDKAAIVALASAISGHKPAANIKALISCDEEIGGKDGIGFVTSSRRDWLADVSLAWIADSSTYFVGIGASGVLGGKIIVHGKGGHAGYPHKAKNAIHLLLSLLEELREFDQMYQARFSEAQAPPGSPFEKVWKRFNITVLDAGTKSNVIPETAMAQFDLRFLPEENQEDAKQEFFDFFEMKKRKCGIDAELEFIYGHKGYFQPIIPVVAKFRENVCEIFGELPFAAELGGNDGSFLFEIGIPTVCFGPIEPDSNFHMANEVIRLETLEKMVRLVRKVICED